MLCSLYSICHILYIRFYILYTLYFILYILYFIFHTPFTPFSRNDGLRWLAMAWGAFWGPASAPPGCVFEIVSRVLLDLLLGSLFFGRLFFPRTHTRDPFRKTGV